MSQLESIAKQLKAQRDREIQDAVNKILAEVEASGQLPDNLTQRIAREIQKVFDRHGRES